MAKKEKKKYPYMNFDTKVAIKREVVENLARMGATQEEIGNALGTSQANISNNYRDAWDRGRSHLGISVRSWQIEKGREGDTPMLVRLGQVYCKDQKNVSETTLEKGSLFASIDGIAEKSLAKEEETKEKPKEEGDDED